MVSIHPTGTPLWVIPTSTGGVVAARMSAFEPPTVQARTPRSVAVTAVVWSGIAGMPLIFTAITYLLGFVIGGRPHS
ncbi:MAG: hypothetical protein ACR2PG_10865 [Hyphomicrobiaceae bacterium]